MIQPTPHASDHFSGFMEEGNVRVATAYVPILPVTPDKVQRTIDLLREAVEIFMNDHPWSVVEVSKKLKDIQYYHPLDAATITTLRRAYKLYERVRQPTKDTDTDNAIERELAKERLLELLAHAGEAPDQPGPGIF